MSKVVFVADGVFTDYPLFSRAAAVAIESVAPRYLSESRNVEIKLTALGSKSLQNMIIEYVDKTKNYLKDYGVTLRDDFSEASPGFDLTDDVAYVAVLNRPRFSNHKQYISRASAHGVEIWSYDGR